jgi:hypothetical protein
VGGDLAHTLHRAAAGGVEGGDDSKQLHVLGARLVLLSWMILIRSLGLMGVRLQAARVRHEFS